MLEVRELVSVTIPFLNGERFLVEAIESILGQTYSRWELFLVDDGSTDRSTAIARDYAARSPESIHYLEHPGHCNLGLPCSRNLGVRNSTGKYLAFLDSDDIWLPQALEQLVSQMEIHPEAGLICAPSEYWYDWDKDGKSGQKNFIQPLAPGGRVYYPPVLLKSCYPLGNYGAPCPSSFLLRRAAFDHVGGFEECFNPRTHQLFEDQAFLAKIYLSVAVFVGDNCLSKYRRHPSCMSSVIEKANLDDAERRFYFRWLRRFLIQNAVRDPGIWCKVIRQTWPYWLHMPPRAVSFLRSVRRRMPVRPNKVQSDENS